MVSSANWHRSAATRAKVSCLPALSRPNKWLPFSGPPEATRAAKRNRSVRGSPEFGYAFCALVRQAW
jgi:hypothetical protein